MSEGKTEIGRVTNFYSKIGVAVIELLAPLNVGDRILFRGKNTNFEQIAESMQIEHKPVQRAEAGQSVGLKVRERVRPGDVVYK
ncbi:MAG: translation elongation factor-like protein [Candidatus Bathyarchaeia archaeon]